MNRHTRSTKSRQFLLSGEAPPATRGVRLYSSLQLECEFLGSPPPTIDWLRGGSLHHKAGLIGDLEEETNSLETLSHGGIAATRSRLYLDCVTPRDQGQYTCRGSTGRELATSSTQLKITGPASADDLLACEQAKEASFRPARIVQWRVRLLAKMGSRIRLPCDATGFPAPVITWTRSFHPVMDEDERVTVTEKGHLIIDSLQWSDMGVYQCTGHERLLLEHGHQLRVPVQVQKVIVYRGCWSSGTALSTAAVAECRATSCPAPVSDRGHDSDGITAEGGTNIAVHWSLCMLASCALLPVKTLRSKCGNTYVEEFSDVLGLNHVLCPYHFPCEP
ncbi:neural/ectodermal development factor IMP-L2-like [Pollicipes pollicipes]|uniref:neural/ectodermal development factor IMP-L2-like n=1 Tax=Pollicipes pollicipes TaxID=41117 RepID=UPI001884E576|nr:neural/ectodermal development factor IMP-L2-like [Pollicipes pollicipes]